MTSYNRIANASARLNYKGKERSLLAAPYVEAYFADAVVPPSSGYPTNVLAADKDEAPAIVKVPWNTEYYAEDVDLGTPADTIQLRWDGSLIGTPYPITEADVTAAQPLDFTLPLSPSDGNNWQSRPHALDYVIVWGAGLGTDFGVRNDAWIDRTPPGGNVVDGLGRLSVPGFPSDTVIVVTRDMLDESGRLVTHVPTYVGEWQGDLIQPWITIAGETVYLTSTTRLPAGELGDTQVVLYFNLADLEAAHDGTHALGYRVTDLAGNVSRDSLGLSVRFVLEDIPFNLDRPEIPLLNDDGVIDEVNARVLDVDIPHFDNAKVGDGILVYFGSMAVAGGELTSTTADPLLTLRVTYADLMRVGNPNTRFTTQATYQVVRSGSIVATSPELPNVRVDITSPGGKDPDPETPDHEALANASVMGDPAGTVNVITPTQYVNNASITVPWPTGTAVGTFLAGDKVTVKWGTEVVPPAARPITTTEVSANRLEPFELLATLIDSVGGGDVSLSYFVEREIAASGGYPALTNTSYSGVQLVQVTGPDELPGGGAELPPGDFPDRNTSNALNFQNTRGGARFQVATTYTNMADGDRIVITFQGLEGRRGTTVLPDTHWVSPEEVVDPSDRARGYVEFRIPEDFFTLVLFPSTDTNPVNRVEVNHTIVNQQGSGATQTGRQRVIDLRGVRDVAVGFAQTDNSAGATPKQRTTEAASRQFREMLAKELAATRS